MSRPTMISAMLPIHTQNHRIHKLNKKNIIKNNLPHLRVHLASTYLPAGREKFSVRERYSPCLFANQTDVNKYKLFTVI